LHLASQHGHLEVVRVLHQAGADVGARTETGEVALHLAASQGHCAVVSYLIDHSDSDSLLARNSYGQRPIEVARDMGTVALFLPMGSESFTGSVSSSFLGASSAEEPDLYVGRTLYRQGAVLLRNSRADVVRRLLHKTGNTLNVPEADVAAGGGKCHNQAVVEDALDNALPSSRRSSTMSSPVSSPSGSMKGSSEGSRRRRTFSSLRPEAIESVSKDSFYLKAILGKGSFGEVYQVVHKRTQCEYAMKVLKKSKVISKNLVRYTRTERNLLSYLRHPFIIRLHYAFQTPSCLVLVLQYCPGGNLATLLKAEGHLPEPLAKLYIAEMVLAIEHLHERQVVYRDLKPENVVLDEQEHAMLTDFGLSKEGVDAEIGTKSFCGSVAYLAPEVLARAGHGFTVDWYGIGVLLYELLSGRPPYYNRNRDTLFKNIASAKLKVPSSASKEAGAFIASLMHRDPTCRLGAQHSRDVKGHEFFKDLDLGQVLRREVPVPPLHSCGSRQPRCAPNPCCCSPTAKVPSPFEGRLEAQVRKQLYSSSQNLDGWEFATPTLGSAATGDGASLPSSPIASPSWRKR